MPAKLTLNLTKSAPALKLSLEKKGIMTMPILDMAILMDVSGSFDDEHRDGVTTDLLTRLAPWGLTFDPDKKIDILTFSESEKNAYKAGELTEANYANYVAREIIQKVPGYGYGTDYSYVLELALKEFGWIPTEAKKAGWFAKALGKKDEAPKAKKRSLVFMITDGDNNDKARTTKVLQDSLDRGDEVYFKFLGVCNSPHATFPYIEGLGAKFKNVGYKPIRDIKAFVDMTDEALNEWLLDDEELVTWMQKA